MLCSRAHHLLHAGVLHQRLVHRDVRTGHLHAKPLHRVPVAAGSSHAPPAAAHCDAPTLATAPSVAGLWNRPVALSCCAPTWPRGAAGGAARTRQGSRAIWPIRPPTHTHAASAQIDPELEGPTLPSRVSVAHWRRSIARTRAVALPCRPRVSSRLVSRCHTAPAAWHEPTTRAAPSIHCSADACRRWPGAGTCTSSPATGATCPTCGRCTLPSTGLLSPLFTGREYSPCAPSRALWSCAAVPAVERVGRGTPQPRRVRLLARSLSFLLSPSLSRSAGVCADLPLFLVPLFSRK